MNEEKCTEVWNWLIKSQHDLGAARRLSPYAVRFRYPSDVPEPERSEAEDALDHAQAFIVFISGLLPKKVKP